MEEMYFIFGVGLIWALFATIQDLKTTEIANWISFSLLAFGLAFKAFYSVSLGELMPFVYAVLGVVVFGVVAFGMNSVKMFAGGDAKFMTALGSIFPYVSFMGIFLWLAIFFVALAFSGLIYSLVYSLFLVYPNRESFRVAFRKELKRSRILFIVVLLMSGVLAFLSATFRWWLLGSIFLIFLPFLYSYLQALDKSCMQKMKKPGELMEGDWIVRPVKVKGRVIPCRVQGLTKEEIAFLRKNKKEVFVQNGIPFMPAFLIAYIMVFFSVFLQFLPEAFLRFFQAAFP